MAVFLWAIENGPPRAAVGLFPYPHQSLAAQFDRQNRANPNYIDPEKLKRSHVPSLHGTATHFPCGHARSGNLVLDGYRYRCRPCHLRIGREAKARRKAAKMENAQ